MGTLQREVVKVSPLEALVLFGTLGVGGASVTDEQSCGPPWLVSDWALLCDY